MSNITAITNSMRSVSLRQATAIIENVAKLTVLNEQKELLAQPFHNIFISGPPGVAKSSLVASVARNLDMDLIDLRLCTMEASTIDGIPFTDTEGDKKVMRYSTPEWWPTGERPTIIVLDELPNATPSVQTAALRLLQERTIQNGKKLPDNVMFVALGNRREDRTGARPLLATVSNRFSMQLEIDPHNHLVRNDWIDWAWDNGIDETILHFLDHQKDMAYQPAREGEGPFPSFRSWTAVSDHLRFFGDGVYDMSSGAGGDVEKANLSNLLTSTTAGAVGELAASQYMAFREHWDKLPDWNKIRKGDPTYKYNFEDGDMGVHYAIASSAAGQISEILSLDYKEHRDKYEQIERVCAYLERIQLDLLVVFIRMSRRIDPHAFSKFIDDDMTSRPDTGTPSTLGLLMHRFSKHMQDMRRGDFAF